MPIDLSGLPIKKQNTGIDLSGLPVKKPTVNIPTSGPAKPAGLGRVDEQLYDAAPVEKFIDESYNSFRDKSISLASRAPKILQKPIAALGSLTADIAAGGAKLVNNTLSNPVNNAPALLAPEIATEGKLSKFIPERFTKAPEVKLPTLGPKTLNDIFAEEIKLAKPLRGKQEEMYSAARSQKVKRATDVMQETSGRQGFYEEKGKLKGELPKLNFEPIENKLDEESIHQLFETVKKHPTFKNSYYDSVSARDGLDKLLKGEVPQDSEIGLLGRVFGADATEAMMKKRGMGSKVMDVLNIPRSIMSSYDVSFPLRQGAALSTRKEYWSSFMPMFKSLGSDKAYQAVQDSIRQKPTYNLARKAGLALTDVIDNREEQYSSALADKLPIIGRGIKGSERAFTAFANKLRMDTFHSLVEDATRTGHDPNKDLKFAKEIASFVNTASGRGNLGPLERSAKVINATFFSPRLMASRLKLLSSPISYAGADPFVRKQALKAVLGYAGAVTTVITAASQVPGVEVNANPINSDFGKIKIGNTRLDMMGGFQQYIRAAAQLVMNKSESSVSGKTTKFGVGYKPTTRLDVVYKFGESKEDPIPSFVSNMLRGTDMTGKKATLSSELQNKLTPIMIQDIHELIKDDPRLLPLVVPAALGAGIQTYSDDGRPQKKNNFGLQVKLPKMKF